MQFGKTLNLFLSFSTLDLFAWPAPLYLVLKNDTEFSLFQAPFDVFSKRFHSTLMTRALNAARFFHIPFLDARSSKRTRRRDE